MTKYLKYILFIGSLLIILVSCGKLTKVNPNEPPYNLQLTKIHQNRVELTWEYTYSPQDTILYYVYKQIGNYEWLFLAQLDKEIKVYQDNINTNDTLLYSYKVKAYKVGDEQFTEDSDIVTYFSEYANPTDINVEQISDKKLKLTWKDNCIGEDGYSIEKKVGNGDWFVLTNSASSPYIDDVNLFEDIQYKIYAYKGITKSTALQCSIESTLMAPDSLTIEKYENSKIRLNWHDNSNGEDNFVIEKKIGSLDWQEYATVDSNTTQFIDDNELVAATLYYRVKATHSSNASQYSNEVSVNILLDQIGEIATPGDAQDLSVQSHDFGVIAYIADMYYGLGVIDCSHPNDMSLTTFNKGLTDRIFSVDSKNNICYFTIHDDPYYNSGFGMFDITQINEGNLNEVDTLYIVGYTTLPDIPYDVASTTSYSYVASGENGISVIIKQGPPHVVTTISTNGDARKCVIDNNLLYVANGLNGGIAIIDISNPNNPVLLSNLTINGYAKDIFASNGYVYLANAEEGLIIIDATDPSNPSVSSSILTNGFVSSVSQRDNMVYITDWNKGFYSINVEDKSNPYIQGYVQMDTNPRSIQVAGSYAYILDNQGLKIIQISQ